MEEEKKIEDKIIEGVENKICSILDEGIKRENVEYLYQLVDIHKDIKNEDYWKEKIMRYRNYGEAEMSGYRDGGYGRRGRYSAGGNYSGNGYGRRGVDAKYRGEEMLENMFNEYGEYSEGRENYGADQETMKSLDKMLQSTEDFMKMLKRDAKSQEEVEMIRETARRISEM